MADVPRDVPPWAEALGMLSGEDALARARRREEARQGGRGQWSVLGSGADPELHALPPSEADFDPVSEAPTVVPLDEAGPREADAVWIEAPGTPR
jgi:hypothetical protein